MIRINKFLSTCGLGSRRKVESYILKKQVFLNGSPVTDLATLVDPEHDTVKCAGHIVKQVSKNVYVMLNKPKGFITTASDPEGRPTVMNLLPQRYKALGIFPVGRLDKDTEGLLLLTNDGELANRLIHPRYESKKEYIVTLDKPLEEKDKQRIEMGVKLREFHAKPCTIDIIDKESTVIKMTIHEGKKRQIRIIFKKFQYKIKKLKRISMGPIVLSNVNSGSFRELRPRELKDLKKYLSIES
ncbi:MAG TPA: pseudouridine synthase [Spirochaetota bacterium]|nr:pseudouridine synthase [Spirochaetota bacterium]